MGTSTFAHRARRITPTEMITREGATNWLAREADKVLVRQLMDRDFVCLDRGCLVEDAYMLLVDLGTSVAPVVNAVQRPLGVVTIDGLRPFLRLRDGHDSAMGHQQVNLEARTRSGVAYSLGQDYRWENPNQSTVLDAMQ